MAVYEIHHYVTHKEWCQSTLSLISYNYTLLLNNWSKYYITKCAGNSLTVFDAFDLSNLTYGAENCVTCILLRGKPHKENYQQKSADFDRVTLGLVCSIARRIVTLDKCKVKTN